jgi:hypothetical protein
MLPNRVVVITRVLPGVAAFLPAALATAVCLLLCACSPGADYASPFPSSSPFPAVGDVPPPRSDTTLDANQVQQATEDLISARDHLSAGGQTKNTTKTSSNSAGAAATKKPPAVKQKKASPPAGATASQTAAGTQGPQGAAAETK